MSTLPAFERLTPHAKRALVCAQQEAEDGPDGYIDTEHILLGLFRVGEGSGYRALRHLGVDELKVRDQLERARRSRKPTPMPDTIMPTSRVRDVVLIAHLEMARAGLDRLHSGHLLAGLALEGTGTAAQMLKAQWIEANLVVVAVEREVASS
ncbi:MAG TPA: Clp protease N-terminal domain-containing protein [Candidatus Dormibacteraeota bacterium]|nr:Clp protease N-terminal domain-containing protein [Candidatus Dormibacteraeota bacterium]